MADPEPKFLNGNLMRHVAVMSFTGSVGLMALFVVDLIDMVFISMLGEAELAAAVGYASAILLFSISVGIGLSITTAALVARSLGERQPERARAYASHVLAFGAGLAVIIAAALWLAVPWLLGLLGADGETLRLATSYTRIIVPTMPVLLVGMAATAVLRAHGDASRAMWATLAGGAVNLVLDPIFIFALDLKLDGAAYASVVARFAVFGAGLWPIFRYHGGLAWPTLKGVTADLNAILGLAVPAVLTNVATPFGAAYVTATMAAFGDKAVAGMAIVGRLTPIAFAVVIALSGAVGPIIGQNFGARRHDRVRQTLVEGLRFVALYVVVVSALLFALRAPIGDLFSAEGLSREIVYLFCGPLALFFFFNGALYVSNAAFNNLNRPFYSTLLNWGRNTLGTIPFVALGAYWGGAPGVMIGQAVGGILFGIAGVVIAFRLISGYSGGDIDPDAPRRPVLRWPLPLNPFSNPRGGTLMPRPPASKP